MRERARACVRAVCEQPFHCLQERSCSLVAGRVASLVNTRGRRVFPPENRAGKDADSYTSAAAVGGPTFELTVFTWACIRTVPHRSHRVHDVSVVSHTVCIYIRACTYHSGRNNGSAMCVHHYGVVCGRGVV